MFISLPVRFWLFVVFLIPSIFCSIFDLSYYLIKRKLRNALYNQMLILIVFFDLFYQLTVIVSMAYFYRTGRPLFFTASYCLFWTFIDYTVYLIVIDLIVWMTIERHILIFHKTWHSTFQKRLLVHYIPMIVLIVYPILFYLYVFIIDSCNKLPDYTKSRCGYSACATRNSIVFVWDNVVNYMMSTLIFLIFGSALFLKIFYYKRRAQQQIRWRHCRKLIIEFVPIFIIYFIISVPLLILNTAYASGVPMSVAADYYSFCMYFSYYGIFLTPIVTTYWLTMEFNQRSLFFQRLRAIIVVRTRRIVPMK